MRIVSQGGKTDLPYDGTIIEVVYHTTGKSSIRANHSGYFCELATYTTEAKAMEVMDMLHREYENCLYSDCISDDITGVRKPYTFASHRVFRFPAEGGSRLL